MGDAGDRRRRPLTEIRSPARRPNPAHKATLTTLWFGDRQTHWKEKTIIASYAARGIKIKSVALKDGYGFLNFDTHKDADNFYGDYNGKSVHRNLQAGETIKWNLRWPGKKEERRAQQPAAPSNSTLPPGLGSPDRAIEGLTSQAQGLESSPRQTNSRAEASPTTIPEVMARKDRRCRRRPRRRRRRRRPQKGNRPRRRRTTKSSRRTKH